MYDSNTRPYEVTVKVRRLVPLSEDLLTMGNHVEQKRMTPVFTSWYT